MCLRMRTFCAPPTHPHTYTRPPLASARFVAHDKRAAVDGHTEMAAKSKGVEEEQERRAELSHLTKHCLLQAAVVLSQNATAGPELTKTLCTEVADAIKGKGKAPAFSGPLVSALDTSKFLEGAITPEEYALLLAEKLEAVLPAGFNVEPLHGLCYRYYSRERRSDITYPKWLTADCTYRLWLVFNCTLDQSLVLLLPAEDFNEIIQKIVELCGFSWAEAYRSGKKLAPCVCM